MNYTTLSSWGPEKTPPVIKQLIIITSLIAILSAGMQSIFEQFNLFPGPENYLSLSWWGLNKGYIWQPLSYLFIQQSQGGLSFYFFLILLFNLYLLWIIGSSVLQMVGKGPFLRLYFIGGIAVGLLTLFSMEITGQFEMLEGMTPALLILLTVWSMAFPETEIHLFFLIPIKIKWIVASLLGATLLITLSHWELSQLFLYLFSILIGYGYAVMIQGWYSPFPFTLKFDLWLSRLASKIRQIAPFRKKKTEELKTPKVNIVDITSGKPLENDDAFVDAMLAKISKKGEDSLTWSEKRRLQEISKNRMRDGQ